MISSPYVLCDEDLDLIREFSELPDADKSSDFWNSNLISSLRERAKQHYISCQNYVCCYCDNQYATSNNRMWDLEHIVARNTHAYFMFEPLNLAASCPDCNIAKGVKNSLVNKRRKRYPVRSSDFLIIHPHYDTFGHHIYRQGVVYIPKTEKGKETIYQCDLLRFAQKLISWSDEVAETQFESEVDSVFSPRLNTSIKAAARIIASLPSM